MREGGFGKLQKRVRGRLGDMVVALRMGECEQSADDYS